jgi:gliding motility-associated-like protein
LLACLPGAVPAQPGSGKAQKSNLLPDTIALCSGDTASIEVRQEVAQQTIRWTTPGGVVENTRRIRAVTPGKYFIRIGGPAPLSDSSYLKIYARPRVRLGDTLLCRRRGAIVLDAGNPGMRYAWSTGESTRSISVGAAGRSWVRVSNGKCVSADTLRVRAWPSSVPLVPAEASFCLSEDNKIVMARAAGERVQWSNGMATPSIAVTREGVYTVRVENSVCGAYADSVRVRFRACDCEMIIPNSFTPNEDNRNDYFFPVLQCDYAFFNITITDRWGNNVYSSNNPNAKWDGRFKGNLCPEDVYVYKIESTERGSDRKQVRNGQVALFR